MSGPIVTKLATETPRMWHVVDAKNQVRIAAGIPTTGIEWHRQNYAKPDAKFAAHSLFDCRLLGAWRRN